MEKQEKKNKEINTNTSLAIYIPQDKKKTKSVYQVLKYFLFFKLMFIFVFIDQITKIIVWNNENKTFLNNIFQKAGEIHIGGTILDIFKIKIPEQWIWVLGSIGAVIALIFMYFLFFQKLPFLMGVSITIMVSGLLGNSYDFFAYKGVRNIIRGINGHFNIADIYIVSGLICYTISIIYYVFIKDYFKKER
ncbi:MAG: signal peptidase II [Mycoplasma sp.]|nr:signal peptidase II [Mycoplasma sp.]